MFSWLLGSGQSIPYEIGEEVEGFTGKTIWKLCSGKDKKDGNPVSIFACHLGSDRSDIEKMAARNAAKRCKTIKHPYTLRVVEVLEIDDAKHGGTVYVVTEPVVPLELELKKGPLPEAATAWGLRCMVSVVAFLNKGGLMHGNIHLGSIFTNRAGDWKLGGFELLADTRTGGSAAFTAAKDVLPRKLQPPELSRGQLTVLEQASPGVVDSWLLGILIYEVFNGRLERPDQLKNTASIPPKLVQDYTRLLSGNVPQRLPVRELLNNPFFDHEFCHLNEFLENLNVKDAAEKEKFFLRLTDQVARLPPDAAKYKVLPALVENLEYGGGTARILTPMLRVAKDLTEDEFHARVVPIVAKLFANNDRAMRMPLLEHLPSIVNLIPAKVLNDTIFASMANGFADTSAQLREMTVKAVVPLAPHLNHRALGHVLRAFAQLQRDEEPAIRTNTTICLGKITQYLDATSRQRVLIAAFCRALLDPFAPARRAGALALAATQAFHSAADCARKVVPAIAPLMIDPDPEVRKAALQCMQVYVAKLEGESRRMAARERGEEVEEPADAMAVGSKVAQESVMESMTWVSSMLGKVGLGGVAASGAAAAGDKTKAQAQTGVPGILQPTPAGTAPGVPKPAAGGSSAGAGGVDGSNSAPQGLGSLGGKPPTGAPPPVPGSLPAARSVSQLPHQTGTSSGNGKSAVSPGAGSSLAAASAADGWAASNDDLTDLLGDADFDTAFSEPVQAPPPPPMGAMGAGAQRPQGPTAAGSAAPTGLAGVAASGSSGSLSLGGASKPMKLGAKKASAEWGADDDFFADLAKPSGGSTSAPPPKLAPPPFGGTAPQLPGATAAPTSAGGMGPGVFGAGGLGMGGMAAPIMPIGGGQSAGSGMAPLAGNDLSQFDPLSSLNQPSAPVLPPPPGQGLGAFQNQQQAGAGAGGMQLLGRAPGQGGPKKLGATKVDGSDWDAW